MKRNDSLRTYLSRKLESVPVGAMSPSNTPGIFLVGVLSVMNQQIGIESQIKPRNPMRRGPPTVRQAKGRFVVGEIRYRATTCLYAIADGGTGMTD
jgi:hypothetical protein